MKLLRTARTLVLALLVLVPALLILPASNAHARDVDGFGPHGYTLDTRSGIAELGQYHLGDLIVYCIDLNSLGPRSASGWTSESPGAVARQVGFGGERGRPGDLRGAVISEQTWAEIAWVLDYTSDKRSHDWAAATDHVIRTRTAGDQAQQQRVDDRFRALSAKHPQAVQHVQTLEKLLTEQAGPYRIDLSWVEEPSLDEAGTARVRVLGAKGNPLPYPVTVTVDGDPVPLPAGGTEHLVEVPAGVGEHRLDAQAKVPAAKPVLYRATHHANAQHTDAKVQRMVGVAPRQELNAQLEASVVARQPSVDTTTTAAEIEAGEELADQVTVTGADPDDQLAIAILYGPYLERPTSEQCRPEDEFARVEFTVTGETPVTTPAVRPTAAGYYTWVIELDESTTQLAHRTACGIAEETTLVSEPEPEPEPEPTQEPTPEPDPTPEPTPEPDPTPEPSPAAPKPEPQPQTLRIRAGGPVPMSVFGPVSGGAALVLLGAAAGEIWQRRRRR